MQKFQIYIFSHKEDPDGIVSAALIKSYLLQKGFEETAIKINLVSYRNFPSKFMAIIPQLGDICLFIADLGMNSEIVKMYKSLPIVDQFPTEINTRNTFSIIPGRRYYIDHHKFSQKNALESIKTRFHKIINPNIEDLEWLERNHPLCTADILNQVLNFSLNSIIGKFTDKSTKYAHITDFPEKSKLDTKYPIALRKESEDLKNYISFFQNDDSELIKLTSALSGKLSWDSFLPQYQIKLKKIKNWIKQQINEIETSKKTEHIKKVRIIHATAKIRPGFISRYLDNSYPGQDLYIGLSIEQKYFNIHTKKPIAHKIAQVFGGGGHKHRAGFKLPEEWENRKLNSVPYELIIEIVKALLNLQNV